MRILHLSKYYKPYSGGIEQVVADICEGCNSNGVESVVLAINHENKNSIYEVNGTKVHSFKSNLNYASADFSLGYINGLRRIIADFDILHIHLPNPLANLAVFLAKNKGKKIVIHWHSDIVKQKKLKFFYKPLQSWLLKRADLIITTSPIYGEHSKDLSKYRDKITTIPIGINPNNYKVNSQKVNEIKRRYADKKIIFALGRLVYYKGFEYLVDAAANLPENYIVLIGGNGEEKPKIVDRINKLELQNKVELLGFVKDIDLPAYFVACDAFCLPSIEKSEAFGVVQIEAFLFNKPVVSCSILGSGVGWVNKNNVSGFVVPPKNSDELSTALLNATSESNKFPELKNYFEENFDAHVMVSRTCEFYDLLLK